MDETREVKAAVVLGQHIIIQTYICIKINLYLILYKHICTVMYIYMCIYIYVCGCVILYLVCTAIKHFFDFKVFIK